MSWTTPRTWVTGEVLSKALLDQQLRDNLAYLKVNIGLEAAVELTIASGVVTKSCAHHKIDTQGDAASDDLDTINGGAEGEVILIRPVSGDRTVTIKHGTGNIWNMAQTDVVLDDADDYALLVYSGSKWGVIGSGLGHHADTHESGGVDVIRLDQLGAPTSGVDFNLQATNNVCIEGLASEPALATRRIYFNTTSKKLFFCKPD